MFTHLHVAESAYRAQEYDRLQTLYSPELVFGSVKVQERV